MDTHLRHHPTQRLKLETIKSNFFTIILDIQSTPYIASRWQNISDTLPIRILISYQLYPPEYPTFNGYKITQKF